MTGSGGNGGESWRSEVVGFLSPDLSNAPPSATLISSVFLGNFHPRSFAIIRRATEASVAGRFFMAVDKLAGESDEESVEGVAFESVALVSESRLFIFLFLSE